MTLQVSIEQAAANALQRWIASQFPPYDDTTKAGVVVSDRWPEPDAELPPKAITILRAGDAREASIQPVAAYHEVIHDRLTPPLSVAAVTDLASCIAALNAARGSYEAHRLSAGDGEVHAQADADNAVTAPMASDQTTAAALANDLRAVIAAHMPTEGVHVNADGINGLAALLPVSSSNLPALVALTKAIVAELNRHYVARIYVWRIASVDQPVQLDVWATYDAVRDDLVATLEQVLHAGASVTMGWSNYDPIAESLTLPLADGWKGQIEAAFDKPSVNDSLDARKRDEYRATYSGTLRTWRYVKAQSARLTRADLRALMVGRSKTTTVANTADGVQISF